MSRAKRHLVCGTAYAGTTALFLMVGAAAPALYVVALLAIAFAGARIP